MSAEQFQPQVVVSLGTDHHRFDRLVDWIEAWLCTHPSPPTCLIQHGASREPRYAKGVLRMPREDILALYAGASVVVVQGGPGSILDARAVGKLPIVVPRRPELHEVVDGHQLAFTTMMAAHGDAIMVDSQEAMILAIEDVLRNPALFQTQPRLSAAAAAADRINEAILRLEQSPTGPVIRRRIQQLWRRDAVSS